MAMVEERGRRPADDADEGLPDGVWTAAAEDRRVLTVLEAAEHVRRLEVVGVVGSTQDVARARVVDGAPDGTLVVAERQTSGRGRRGRTWEDDARPGASLAATLVLDGVHVGDDVALLPHAAGLAVRDAVAPWLGTRAVLKWPNDVVVREHGAARKVAGLLVEREDGLGPTGRTVLLVGIGVNVDRRHLPPVRDRVGVADLAGADVAPAALLAGLVAGLDAALVLMGRGRTALLERYRAASDSQGREVRVLLADGAQVRGEAAIDDEGRLVVTSVLGRHKVLTGTVRDGDDEDASVEA